MNDSTANIFERRPLLTPASSAGSSWQMYPINLADNSPARAFRIVKEIN